VVAPHCIHQVRITWILTFKTAGGRGMKCREETCSASFDTANPGMAQVLWTPILPIAKTEDAASSNNPTWKIAVEVL